MQTSFSNSVPVDQRTSRTHTVPSAVRSLIDALSFGLLIIRSNGELSTVNSAATHMIDSRDWIRLTDNRLRCSGQGFEQLHDQFLQVIELGESASLVLQDSDTAMDSRADADCLLLTISPLNPEESLGAALAVMVDPNANSHINTDQLTLLYSLTDAEADITAHLACGLDYAEISQKRNVSVNTIRSYSKSIFKKLAVKSRAEVVRKVLKSQVPVLK